jgi:hypothetical protein
MYGWIENKWNGLDLKHYFYSQIFSIYILNYVNLNYENTILQKFHISFLLNKAQDFSEIFLFFFKPFIFSKCSIYNIPSSSNVKIWKKKL